MSERKGAYRICLEKLREIEHLEDPGLDGRIVIRWIFQEVGWRGRDWIDLAQDSGRWRVFVNAAMNLRVP
jgi:hypothetical protein